MGRYSRLGKNTLLVFLGNIGSKLISLLMLPFYTKWLSLSDYGTTDMISVYASFLLSIITCCLAEAIFIYPKDQEKSEQQKYFSSGILFVVMCFLLSAVIFFIINQIFFSLNESNTFTDYTWFIWGIIVATFFQTYIQQFSRSIDNIRVYAISGVVLTAATALFSFILLPLFGLMGYLYAQIISLIISILYSSIAIKAHEYILIKKELWEYCKKMLKYSIPLIPNAIMWWLVSALNRPIMEDSLGMEAIGIYAVANKFPSIIVLLFTIFSYSWQISVIEEFNKEGYHSFYNKILRMIFLILAFVICLMTVFSKFIVSFMADEKFYEAWKYIPILSIAVLFSSLSGYVGANFSATRESKYFFYSSVWGAGASVLLNFLLIPYYGLWGACVSVVLSYFVMALSRIKYSWKYVKIEHVYKYFLIFLVCSLTIYVSYFTEGVLKISLYTFFFFALLFINKDLYGSIKKILVSLKNKV